ncbi:hypothetical protein ACO2Q8_23865 [Larkinella sp. VNQ87]|uniref:hypothetical protein n=1 Tax=Larkinella sp. VNQ87 TaxID=3400921 RepID=UPI003C0F6D7C
MIEFLYTFNSAFEGPATPGFFLVGNRQPLLNARVVDRHRRVGVLPAKPVADSTLQFRQIDLFQVRFQPLLVCEGTDAGQLFSFFVVAHFSKETAKAVEMEDAAQIDALEEWCAPQVQSTLFDHEGFTIILFPKDIHFLSDSLSSY